MSTDAPSPAAPPPTAQYTPPSWTAALRLDELFTDPSRPLDIDLGCGKGRFLAARAARCPERNFLGIDRLLVRVRKVDRKLQRAGACNARLLRIENAYAVERLLPAGCVSTFYVFFPDPWPKRRHHPRRLFSPTFIASVHRALVPGGAIHIRTDHQDYAAEIRKRFAVFPGFEPTEPFEPAPEEISEFEALFTGQGLPVARASYRRC